MHFRSILVVILTCMTLFAALPTAAAQDTAPEAESAESAIDEQAEEPEYPFTPGTFDLMLTGGLSLTMPYLEPGVEIGMIPLTDELTLGIGANVAVGACILCSVLTFITPSDFEISAWFVHPLLRAGVHFNMLSDTLDMPHLDLYAGALAGPGIYTFDMQIAGNDFRFRQISLLLGPWPGPAIHFPGIPGFSLPANSGSSPNSVWRGRPLRFKSPRTKRDKPTRKPTASVVAVLILASPLDSACN